MSDLERARSLFEQALALHAADRLEEAEALYRQALQLAPERPSVLVNLGAVLLRTGRAREAQRLARRALVREPDGVEALSLMIEAKRLREGLPSALAEIERLLAQHPGLAALHLQRSSLLAEAGRVDEALEAVGRSLALEPGQAVALTHRAQLLLATGEVEAARALLAELLANTPGFPAAGEIWSRILLRSAEVRANESALLVRALDTPWAAPRELWALACQSLRTDPRLGPWIERAGAAWPSRLPAQCLVDLRLGSAVFAHPLLRALLRQPAIPDASLHRLLANLRAWALERAAEGAAELNWEQPLIGLLCAMAAHQLRNPGLWPLTPAEQQQAERLRLRMAQALDADGPVPAAWPPCLLLLEPGLEEAALKRLDAQAWPAPVKVLLTQAQERGPLTAPRAPGLRFNRPPCPPRRLLLPDYLQERLWPRRPLPLPTQQAPRVLALACGAGEWALELATRIQGVQLLACEQASDGRAWIEHQAARLRLPAVRTCSPSELADIDAQFELIDSGHRLLETELARGEELARWRTRLAPLGLLRIRLASARLRASLRAARARLRAAGLSAEPAQLAMARALLLELPADDAAAGLLQLPEFHAPDACLRLLAHWRDEPLGLSDLQRTLSAAGLQLAGFELGCADRAAVAQAELPEASEDWGSFEAAHSDAFQQFYTLWVCAPAGSAASSAKPRS